MIFKLANKSDQRLFKTYLGLIAIDRGNSIETEDEKLVHQIAAGRKVKVEKLRNHEPVEIRLPSSFDDYKLKDLQAIARKVRMKGILKLRKKELIEKLQEAYG